MHVRRRPQGTTYCRYAYRVLVTGPVSFSASQISDMALNLMGNSVYYRPVPCKDWKGMRFCTYFEKATYCAATSYIPNDPLNCVPVARR